MDSVAQLIKDCENAPKLSEKEELELLALRPDSEAIDKLLKANLRLVIFVAKQYRGQGLDFSDLVQEGVRGYLRGVEKWDAAHGVRLNSYALYWVRNHIGDAVTKYGHVITLPVNGGVPEYAAKVKKVNYDTFNIDVPMDEAEESAYPLPMLEKISGLVKQLEPRLRTIIEMRFYREEKATLDEVAETLQLTKERVRQLQILALAHLRELL
jgi:RNA polymerase sigma factor (sigma-70 family)